MYKEAGASIVSRDEALKSKVVVKLNAPTEDEAKVIDNNMVIAQLGYFAQNMAQNAVKSALWRHRPYHGTYA